jgi:hypothetical protein
MASNFKIVMNRYKGFIQLSLYGDFDATSAYELINLLNKSGPNKSKIYIHTDGLNQIHLFGLNILKKSIGIENNFEKRIKFSGDRASDFTELYAYP